METHKNNLLALIYPHTRISSICNSFHRTCGEVSQEHDCSWRSPFTTELAPKASSISLSGCLVVARRARETVVGIASALSSWGSISTCSYRHSFDGSKRGRSSTETPWYSWTRIKFLTLKGSCGLSRLEQYYTTTRGK